MPRSEPFVADAPAQELHRATLWTMRKHNRRVTAELLSADGQWQLRLFAQGVLFLWYPCAGRDEALAYAQLIQDDFVHDHWYHGPRRGRINGAHHLAQVGTRS